jgi:hypothetical protein
MRFVSLAIVGMLLGALGCSDKTSGECNICPTSTTVDLAACAEEGKKAGCAVAEIKEVTDDQCDIGKAPITHNICVYSDCSSKLDCSAVRTF